MSENNKKLLKALDKFKFSLIEIEDYHGACVIRRFENLVKKVIAFEVELDFGFLWAFFEDEIKELDDSLVPDPQNVEKWIKHG